MEGRGAGWERGEGEGVDVEVGRGAAVGLCSVVEWEEGDFADRGEEVTGAGLGGWGLGEAKWASRR